MSIKLETDHNKIELSIWSKFLLDHPNGNFFQSYEFFQLHQLSIIQNEPISIFAIDSKGIVVGILVGIIHREKGYIKSKLSSRCVIVGGPLVKYSSPKIVDLLISKMDEITNIKSIYIEFRNLFSQSKYGDIFIKKRYSFRDHYNYIVSIESNNNNFQKLNKTKRTQLRKSLKNNCSIIQPTHINEILEFYSLLKTHYKTKVKKPMPEFSFFEYYFYNQKLGKYFLVKYKGNIIGGILAPIYKNTIYELFICGLDREYKNIYPSVLATWAPIEYANNNNLQIFDFLGAGSLSENIGIREFKRQFGGELVKYGRFIKINNLVLYNLGKFILNLKKKFSFL